MFLDGSKEGNSSEGGEGGSDTSSQQTLPSQEKGYSYYF